MIVTTKQLFQHAYGRYAVGAYNINNLEQTAGLFRGNLGKVKSNDEPADPAKSAPFIIQISRGARGYTDKRFLEAMIHTAEEVFPEAIFAVHLDHGQRTSVLTPEPSVLQFSLSRPQVGEDLQLGEALELWGGNGEKLLPREERAGALLRFLQKVPDHSNFTLFSLR